ncbi:hypothetical protein C8F04DRAFT_1260993 [Mycena alexandri]|uniref:Uncharacterized protein n=1 Tax=Mycena alexandri TaxID=1745969 RepID=A0AAD6SU72_9AGAR|nr:hypothetical protein C8F04DRAFT_1260993 [Mycena alexandri]
MTNTQSSITPALNDMRSPFMYPEWPTSIRSLAELQAYIQHPASDALGHAIYKADFFPPKGLSYERDSTSYLQEDVHTPFTFTVFGQLGRIEAGKRVIVVGCPDDCPDRLKALFAYQTEALMAPVIDDDFTAESIRAEVCTDGSRETGRGGHYIELRLGHASIIHTGNGLNVVKSQITPTDIIPLRVGDWLLIKCTYHKYVDYMGDMRREYEAYAWHIRSVCVTEEVAAENHAPLSLRGCPEPSAGVLLAAAPIDSPENQDPSDQLIPVAAAPEQFAIPAPRETGNADGLSDDPEEKHSPPARQGSEHHAPTPHDASPADALNANAATASSSEPREILATVSTPKRKRGTKRSASPSTLSGRTRAQRVGPLDRPRTRSVTKAALSNDRQGASPHKRR